MGMTLETFLRAAQTADVVFVDGASGSGKTELAKSLWQQARDSGRTPVIWHLDELYAGWNGLNEGSLAVAAALAGSPVSQWDWHLGRARDPRPLPGGRPLIIEGCGSLTNANLAAARDWAMQHGDEGAARQSMSNDPEIVTAWLECDLATRKERALARDGDMFRPYWSTWAAAERQHFSRHQPWKLAQFVIDTNDRLEEC